MAKWLLLSGMLLITTDIHSHKKKIYFFIYNSGCSGKFMRIIFNDIK
jgi:hypothetical protein